jgi:putative tryptophan/tyrosine transport system substrate-binding protein
VRRREFIALGSAAIAWPVGSVAQQDRARRIGVLMGFAETDGEGQTCVAAFREALQKLGWAEGHNIRTDYRWTALATSNYCPAMSAFGGKADIAIRPRHVRF